VPDLILARFLGKAASIHYFQGDHARAEVFAEDSLARCRSLNDVLGVAMALGLLANVAESSGDADRTVKLAEEALGIYQRINQPVRSSGVLNTLALLAWRQGDYARSELLQEQSHALARARGDQMSVARALTNLGLVATDRGDYARASRLQREALLLQATFGNKYGLADCFENIAHNVVHLGGDEFVAQLFSVADALRTQIGSPSDPSDRAYNDGVIQRVRTRLGEVAFTSAWNAARTLSLDEAITLALNDPSLPSNSDPPMVVDVFGLESESV
jgi:tetratricopeptide (TPR) repeat protein